jgi:iron complex outermembrane receptor protein
LNSTALDPLGGPVITSQQAFGGIKQLANAPLWEFAGDFSHRFRLPGGASLTPEVQADYRTRTYITQSVEPYAIQPGYGLVNAFLTFTSADGKYGLTGYMRNVGNLYYRVGGTLNNGASLSSQGVNPGFPRTYGLVLNAHF